MRDESGKDGWRKMRKEKMQGVAASEKESLTYDELQFCNDTALSLSNRVCQEKCVSKID